MKKVVIAGGSGFIGHALVAAFNAKGYEVAVLSRGDKAIEGARRISWDGKTLGAWQEELNGAHAVVNLCGESIMQRWTPASFAKIRESRIKPTELIGEAIANATTPPQVWINASATGYYGDTGTREISEASPAGKDTLGKLCQEWEAAVDKARTPSTVKTKVRIGIVMGKQSEAFKQLSRLTNLLLGGNLGTGSQYFSWIHVQDLVNLIVWAAENPTNGAVNACSPEPVTNSDLMAAFRKHYGVPIALPAPEFAVKAITGALGWDPQMLLGGTRAVPAIAEARGFEFRFPTIEAALTDLIDDVPASWKTASTPAT